MVNALAIEGDETCSFIDTTLLVYQLSASCKSLMCM